MAAFAEQVCDSGHNAEHVPHSDLIAYKLIQTVEIVRDGEDKQYASAVAGIRWTDCAQPKTHIHGGAVENDMWIFKDQMRCVTCTQDTHRGGAPRFAVTSHACAWDPENEVCGPS